MFCFTSFSQWRKRENVEKVHWLLTSSLMAGVQLTDVHVPLIECKEGWSKPPDPRRAGNIVSLHVKEMAYYVLVMPQSCVHLHSWQPTTHKSPTLHSCIHTQALTLVFSPGYYSSSIYLCLTSTFYLFIYLFLAVLGLRFCERAFSGCGERGPLFIAARGPLTIAASLVAEHRLQTRRLSSCGSRA